MGYALQGRIHAALLRLRDESGQGTVEYVALILLIAGVLAGVVAAGKGMNGASMAKAIVAKLQDSLESVGGK
jgi:Flp pilus assembly protein TadG